MGHYKKGKPKHRCAGKRKRWWKCYGKARIWEGMQKLSDKTRLDQAKTKLLEWEFEEDPPG